MAARTPAVLTVVGAVPDWNDALTKVRPAGSTSASVALNAVVLLAPACESVTVNATGLPASPPVGAATFTTCSAGSAMVTFAADTVAVPPV